MAHKLLLKNGQFFCDGERVTHPKKAGAFFLADIASTASQVKPFLEDYQKLIAMTQLKTETDKLYDYLLANKDLPCLPIVPNPPFEANQVFSVRLFELIEAIKSGYLIVNPEKK